MLEEVRQSIELLDEADRLTDSLELLISNNGEADEIIRVGAKQSRLSHRLKALATDEVMNALIAHYGGFPFVLKVNRFSVVLRMAETKLRNMGRNIEALDPKDLN